MKKIFGILLVSSILFVSCSEDLLEPFTPGSLTEDVAIKKSSDLVNLVNSSMNILTNRTEYVFSSVFTDEASPGSQNGGQGVTCLAPANWQPGGALLAAPTHDLDEVFAASDITGWFLHDADGEA